jgi:hypothetical protein
MSREETLAEPEPVPLEDAERIDAEARHRPDNDHCRNATPLRIDQKFWGTLIGATCEGSGEPACGNAHASRFGDVWFRIDGTNEYLYATTCTDHPQPWFNGDMDTEISVFSGRPGRLQCVGGNDDYDQDGANCGNGRKSRVNFYGRRGTRYYICVHSYGGNLGTNGRFGIQVKRRW